MFDILDELIEDVKDAEKSSDVESGDAFHLRQTEAPWATEVQKYGMTIVGAGNIGSWLALYAARSRAGVTIMDMDTVEAHNIGGQFFKKADIGKNKAIAVAANIAMFNDKSITARDYAMTPKSGQQTMRYTQIVCSAVDSMKGRRETLEAIERIENRKFFVDGRANAEQFQIFAFSTDDHKKMDLYKKNYLFSDDEVEDAPCNFKSTTHAGSMLAAMMWSIIINYIVNQDAKIDLRVIPFRTEVNLPLFKIDQYED